MESQAQVIFTRIELARKRGRDHARHLLLFYGIETINPHRQIEVTEASEQEIALHQEVSALRESDESAYLQSVEDAGGWEAFLEQRKAFHEEVDLERQRLWQAQIDLYGH